MGSNQKWYRVHYWPEVTGRGPVRKSPDCFPQFCSRTLFSRICFPVLFPRIVFRISPYFFPVFFPRIFVPYFFYIFFQYLFSLCEYGCCCCYCCCHISQSSSSSHAYRGNISTENRYKKNTGKQFTGKNYGKNTKKNTKKKVRKKSTGEKSTGKKLREKVTWLPDRAFSVTSDQACARYHFRSLLIAPPQILICPYPYTTVHEEIISIRS